MSRPPARSIDALLSLLADWRRRAILRRLSTGEDETTLDALVAALSADGPDGPDGAALRTELHHHHLPRLEDAGVVEYDPSTGTVSYRPDERVESLLDALAEELDERR